MAALPFVSQHVSADPVLLPLEVKIDDPLLGDTNPHRGSFPIPTVGIDGHTLYIYDVTSPLALTVVDENQQVIYTAYVPAGNTTLVLPATLTGTFELQLYPGGDYYFAAEITL